VQLNVERWKLDVERFFLGFLVVLLALPGSACGPFFPNNLLGSGDAAVLAAPVADFERELERMDLAPGRFEHVAATNGCAQQAFEAETADLAAALKRMKVSGEEAARITGAHAANRKRLTEFVEAFESWKSKAWMDESDNSANRRGPRPVFPQFAAAPGLPGEFAEYFAGTMVLRNPDSGDGAGRAAWERLLALPAAERKYKSTWAAFMLGKSWEDEDDDKAVDYFRQTRELARRGFADSIGLAAAALGLEARVELHRNHFRRAIELYLEQYAAGDGSAVQSLQITAERAIESADAAELKALATATTTRQVMMAYLISGPAGWGCSGDDNPAASPVLAWLAAVEAADVKDVGCAERLALAAYQAGAYEAAQRWIKRARGTPVAQWLQAKLWLREGKVPQAAALLAKVASLLPAVPESTLTNSAEFADSLHVVDGGEMAGASEHSARAQVWGELGVLRLSRGEFTQALDALLRSGYWEDTAYVAERVLTVDELKAYVDREWPAVGNQSGESSTNAPARVEPERPLTPSLSPGSGEDQAGETDVAAENAWARTRVRCLLARRLVREFRAREARDYFPAEQQPRLDELTAALDAGWNESAPAAERARSLFAAAKIVRADGMELLGTELAPDWAIHDGNFDWGLTGADRTSADANAVINIATEAELNRASQHRADPEVRFHYRYQAAFLAWEASKLMPDNSDETARVLCTAGTWLKVRDAETADLFYKALVRRCRKTAIGDQADRMRWFPVLDAEGNPVPYEPHLESVETPELPMAVTAEPAEELPVDFPMPGKVYIIHPGDSLDEIANAASTLGVAVRVEQILEANPGLEAASLRIGQGIVIPEVPGEQTAAASDSVQR
jgi:hypothetical protein